MSKKLPRSVRLRRKQQRRKKSLLRDIRKLLGVKRIHRGKRLPVQSESTGLFDNLKLSFGSGDL